MLGTPAAELEALLTDRTTRYRVIRRWVDPSTARTILESLAAGELRFSGVFIEYHQRRIYPAGPSAAALLGAVNDEGTGVAGVEAYYDDILRGRAGIITAENLADLATDELLETVQLDENRAQALIMAARQKLYA